MHKTSLTIGFYGAARHELDNRRFEGVLKFCSERGYAVRDFRMLELIQDIRKVAPPWRGKIDGLVFCDRQLPGQSETELAD
ncbi:MAG: hypothetical protein QM811_02730 [Pirellulales bacterium]